MNNKREFQDFITKDYLFDSESNIAVTVKWYGSEYRITNAWKATKTLDDYPFRRSEKDWKKVYERMQKRRRRRERTT